MKKLLDEKYLTLIIIISMIAFPLFYLIGDIIGKEFFLQEEYLSLVGLIWSISMFVFGIFCLVNKKYRPKKIVLSDIFIVTSIIFSIISIIFSLNINWSLTGMKHYSETPLQVLGYFGLFFMCTLITKEENKRAILNTFFVLGIFESGIAFLQNFRLWPYYNCFLEKYHFDYHVAFGLTQSCNVFVTLGIIFTALFSAQFIYSETKKEQIIYLISSIICSLGTLFTYTAARMVRSFYYFICTFTFRNLYILF